MRCTIVAVAAERYRRANNRWPDKVEDLTNGRLAPWATEPFTGGPIRLERRKDGLNVLAQGKDSATVEGAGPERRGSSDVSRLVRLYDVNQRRQPPAANAADDRDMFDRQPPGSR
jgi:hypothetical protein